MDRGHRSKCGNVARVEVEDLLPALERIPLASKLLSPDASETFQESNLFLRLLGDSHLAFQDVDEIAPIGRGLVEIGQGIEGHRILTAQVEDVGPEFLGAVHIVQRVGGDLRHAGVAFGPFLVAVNGVVPQISPTLR